MIPLTEAALRNLLEPFLALLAAPGGLLGPVYVSRCCDRVYAGREIPQLCRTCKRAPASHAVTALDQLPALAETLNRPT